MSLRKWAAALSSAPQARGHQAVNANKPTAPVKASKALLGPHTLQRVNRLNHQVIKRATITSRREKCTPIFCPARGGVISVFESSACPKLGSTRAHERCWPRLASSRLGWSRDVVL